MIDLSQIPLSAISNETKELISLLLNPQKVLPAENGLPRDWRGLAHLSHVDGKFVPSIYSNTDPTKMIFEILEKKKSLVIADLQLMLEDIDRWDIVEDVNDLLERDAKTYLDNAERSKISAEEVDNAIDNKVLTVDDMHRMREGLEKQFYDAFVLYADEDANYADKVVDNLEKTYKLKLCLKDRDLIGGLSFQHEAVMTLISERCNRLLVIITPKFLKSPANEFFLNYAQALGIEKRQRKIIPCLFETCQIPPALNFMYILDYNRRSLFNFWERLRDSVQVSICTRNNSQSIAKEEVKEINSESKLPIMDATKDNLEQNYYSKPKNITKIIEELPVCDAPLSDSQLSTTDSMKSLTSVDSYRKKKKLRFLKWTKKKLNFVAAM